MIACKEGNGSISYTCLLCVPDTSLKDRHSNGEAVTSFVLLYGELEGHLLLV